MLESLLVIEMSVYWRHLFGQLQVVFNMHAHVSLFALIWQLQYGEQWHLVL